MPPRLPHQTNRWVWIILVTILVLFLLGRLVNLSGGDDGFGVGEKVGVLRIEGAIYASRQIVEDLDELARRSDVKALVVRIDSPGGVVAPSQEIYEKVRRVRAEKPVVISMGSVAASGGYYIALGGSRIVANRGTITGSIGVIMEYPVAVELLDKLGLSIETVKSGKLKDSGSPTRSPTDADRRYFQNVVNELHQQFVSAVALERNLDLDSVRELADGSVFTGTQSLNLGLIDTLGTYEDAVSIAAELGGIKGKPKTVRIRHRRPTLMEMILGEREPVGSSWFDSIPAYRWRGKIND
ncbi:MAG: signal peptide peptidase SppA [Candidatus Neomarinimicrobiota bacterium]